MSNISNFSFECTEDWIRNKYTSPDSSLNVLQLNIRGINDLSKFDCVGELLQRLGKRVDIIVLGETMLKEDRTHLYNLPGYKSVFSCRKEAGGGLAVFCLAELNINIRENRVLDGFHHVHLELSSRGKLLNIHAVYRPPSFDASRFLAELEGMLAGTMSSQECIVIGDVNIPTNIITNNVVREYSRLLSSFNMVVTNTSVTRPASNNVLDHVVCSENLAGNVVNETNYCDLSDHNWIATSFKFSRDPGMQTFNKHIVDHTQLNHLFTESLAGLSQHLTANEKLLHVIDSYNMLKTQCTKTATIRAKVKEHCPWMTFNIWKLIQIKEKTLKKQRRNRSNQQLADMLAHVSLKLQQEKTAAKRNYYDRLLSGSDQKSAWKVINDVLGKRQTRAYPNELNVDGQAITDMTKICDTFNDFFCNIGPNLAATLNSDRDIQRFGTIRQHQFSMFLRPSTVGEVTILINNLDSQKSAGYDNIPVYFIKQHFGVFAPLLSDIFNEIVETGTYPDCLKIARVTPIHKAGDSKDPGNFRPISCLSVLDKIIEKLLVSRIINFVDKYKLIYKHQYGFRQGLSTLTASCDLVESIYEALDERNIVGALFVDLKKAFDTIDHNLLLKKLEMNGIRGVALNLIKSYLENRTQFVAIGEFRSQLGPVTTGVPQGSNLGPILFLLFINDLAKLNLTGKVRLFADDTSIFYNGVGEKYATVVEQLQQRIKADLELLNDYFCSNLLSMNLTKTKYMLVHSPWIPIPAHEPVIVCNRVVEEVFSFEFLGLTLDSTMSWAAHVDLLKRKLSSLCGVLRKTSSFLPTSALKKLYFALIHSRLQYLIANWGHAQESCLQKLQVIQNRCLKIVFRRPFLYPTRLLYNDPKDSILPVRAMHEFQMLLHIRKNINSPDVTLVRRRMHEGRASRQAGHFYLVRARTEFGRKKIAFIGSKLYNALPQSCKDSPTFINFKKTLRAHLKSKVLLYLPRSSH